MSQLDDIATRYQVQLEGLKASESAEFNKVLQDLLAEIESEIGATDISEISRTRLEQLIRSIISNQKLNIEDAMEELLEHLKDLALYAYEFEAGAIMAATTAEGLSTLTDIDDLWNKISKHPLSFDGSLLSPWLKKLSDNQIGSIEGVLRRAHSMGWSTRQVLQAVRGTRQNRYTDGIMQRIGRGNETIIRTAVQHASSVARLKVWQDNSDVVKGYRWVSTLDSKTSDLCRSLDGEEFGVGEGPVPPAHPNCRSVTVPTLDPVFDILGRGATRSSASGPVSQSMTYYQWLKTQPAEFQDSVIGPTRAKLLRDGGLSVEEFTRLQLNRVFEPLTLDEMRRRKPLAFIKAGI